MYSQKIEILIRFLRKKNVVVEINTELPDLISGCCDYNNRKILLHEPSAKPAYHTLLHECGHWLLYEQVGWLPQWMIPRFVREIIADTLGTMLRLRLS